LLIYNTRLAIEHSYQVATVPKFTSHIFVCCNQRQAGNSRGCCDPDGSEQLRGLFKAEVKRRGLGPEVRANRADCLDQCECGPTVVIYPQQIWYGGVRPEDVPRIIEETVVGGRVLEDLLISDEVLNTKGAGKPSSKSDA
jgi:(2Fe-2S) ferredoxin